MDFSIIAVVAAVVIFVVLLLSRTAKQSPQNPNADFPYEKTPLCSPAERSFLGVLEQVSDSYRIFAKVSLYDVIKVKKGLTGSERQAAFNRISRKHLDFILCEPSTFRVLCAVELDDSSHKAPARRKRDDFLEEALRTAGVPLLRFPVKQAYSLSELREQFRSIFPLDVEPVAQPSNQTQTVKTSEKMCPNCTAELVVKTAKKGVNAGKSFLACPNYPDCKFTAAL